MFPDGKCLFCENRIKRQQRKEVLLKCITITAELSIKKAAEQKQDEQMLLKVRDIDLVAREAYYHASCRGDYTRVDNRYPKSCLNKDVIAEQHAHQLAFDYICQHVKENIIDG